MFVFNFTSLFPALQFHAFEALSSICGTNSVPHFNIEDDGLCACLNDDMAAIFKTNDKISNQLANDVIGIVIDNMWFVWLFIAAIINLPN